MQSFFVTGATGHVGNVLVQELLKIKDAKVKLLILPGEDVSTFNNLDVQLIYGNVLDFSLLKKEINSEDVVFHLAGIIDISSDKKDLLYKVNVEGTKNMAKACFEKKVKRMVYTSTVHVIPPLKKGDLLEEPINFDENQIVGDYAKSKVMATKIVLEYVVQGLDAVVVYPAGVIGPFDYKVSEMGSLIIDIANNKIGGKVTGGYNFVDVRDVAAGIVKAYQKGEAGKGYILSGEMVTISDLFKYTNLKFGKKKFVPLIAMWFIKMFASLAELHYKIRKKKPLFTKYSLYTVSSNHNFSNRLAKEKLGFSARPAKQSIFDAIDWFVKNKPELFSKDALKNNKEM